MGLGKGGYMTKGVLRDSWEKGVLGEMRARVNNVLQLGVPVNNIHMVLGKL